jgi:pimeloyl-ACP methyl ester carboxylesterase
MRLARRSVLVMLALLAPVAAAAFARASDAERPKEHERLIHLPGIAGARLLDRYFVAGIHDGGYAGRSETYDWTAGDPGVAALLARRRNEREAEKVAARIEKLLTDDPDLKVRIVCHSGGAGIAAWALERLPDGMQIETLVMIAPALSPRYDLSKALAHVRGKAYAFTSPNDAIVLGAGTRLLGTIDGVKTEAAGLHGFVKPDGADDAQYAKLVPMPYAAEWMDLGNIGDHIGPMGRTFAREVISPIVQGHEPEPTTRPVTGGGEAPGENESPASGEKEDAAPALPQR